MLSSCPLSFYISGPILDCFKQIEIMKQFGRWKIWKRQKMASDRWRLKILGGIGQRGGRGRNASIGGKDAGCYHLHLHQAPTHLFFAHRPSGGRPQQELPPGVVKFVPPRRGLNWNSTEKIWENGEINAFGLVCPSFSWRWDSGARMSTMCARGQSAAGG